MKKLLSILLVFSLFLVSCKEKIEKFSLSEEYYTSENKGLNKVDNYDQIQLAIDNQKSFAVYVFLSGCSTCRFFEPILEEYLDTNNLMFYSISITITNETDNSISEVVDLAPSVILFNQGKVVTFLDSTSNKHTDYYKSVEGFNEWFTTYVELN